MIASIISHPPRTNSATDEIIDSKTGRMVMYLTPHNDFSNLLLIL